MAVFCHWFLFLLFLLPISGQSQGHSSGNFSSSSSSFSISDPEWYPWQENRTLRSQNSLFAAGFLPSPSSFSFFVFSVWVEVSIEQTRVWSLSSPVPFSARLFISTTGELILSEGSGPNLLHFSASTDSKSSALRLNNDGSLTFNNWTSFSSPSDTLLPNQRLPKAANLSSGDYGFDGTNLFFKNRNFWSIQSISYLNSDGVLIDETSKPTIFMVTSDYGQKGTLRRLTLDPDGNLRVYSLLQNLSQWEVVWVALVEPCVIPNTCGPNSICIPNPSFAATKCVCAPGFRTSAHGCVRKMSFLPSSKFLPLENVEFTTEFSSINLPLANLNSCRSSCLSDSNCVAFTYVLNRLQSCFIHGELLNGFWSPFSEFTLFLRLSSFESDFSNFTDLASMIETACPVVISLPVPPKEKHNTIRDAAILSTLLALELLLGALCFMAFLRRYSKYRDMARMFGLEFLPGGIPKRFSFAELRVATANFSNILGSGGNGTVYRGQLHDGRTVAVKQLRKGSGGDNDFWAEVTIMARMHHLNLVRIWGFCAEKEQRLLVYEYIPNGSLDKFLFQSPAEIPETEQEEGRRSKTHSLIVSGGTRPVLDLGIRYRIALGVARAIAYLHEECLEWVIHCDIKPENILLDENFCPKVSDFGLSKLTTKKERVSMSKDKGTRGYMAPEWVISEEPITAKADVYSFGVVLLELVAGIRCLDFRRDSLDSVDWYFQGWAYDKVFVERKVEDVLDERLPWSTDDVEKAETAERMVTTAMWCLQDQAEARPTMGKVAKMLEGSVELTTPEKPTIFYSGEANSCADLLPLSEFGSNTKSSANIKGFVNLPV
ncbi:hypothetical protein HPP92_013125 [Vanilla planifolia]|uniref:non-specific serine/threonine protein kinase n=1 Tax=Vanilla planifolia TaxID=51239 RepID=A0A835QPE7_VANPL|nr:hypothetical protein HPP92_013125 [Vanilla planifolia]